jgi:hypothetical protein
MRVAKFNLDAEAGVFVSIRKGTFCSLNEVFCQKVMAGSQNADSVQNITKVISVIQ